VGTLSRKGARTQDPGAKVRGSLPGPR
jgi:hypothetical protein